ncbi:42975_t:CDS:2, partial [Gigaspora margarita]
HLNQKLVEYGEAKKLLSGLTDLNYKPDHGEHRYFEYLLLSNARGELTSEDNTKNIALLKAYHPEKINSQYIIQVAGKGFTAIDHPSKVYEMPDTHECIDGNKPLHPILDINARQKPNPTNPELPSLDGEKITHEDLMSRILIACADALYLIPGSKNRFHKLENYLVQPKANCSVIWPRTFSSEKSAEEKFQPIEDEDTLVKGSNLIGKIGKGLINFRVQLPKECPICEVRHKRDQLYRFLLKDGRFILKCFQQKQYKPDHKGLVFGEVTNNLPRPKWGLSERIVNIIKRPRPLLDLFGKNINVKEMEDAPEAYPDFSSEEPTTTLIRSPIATGKPKTLREILNSLAKSKANLPCFNWISYHKTLSNETKGKVEILQNSGLRVCYYQENGSDLAIHGWDVIIVQVESTHHLSLYKGHSYVVILDEANAIMHQMSSGIHAQESENTMQDLLKLAVHVVAMDAFGNESTLAFLKAYQGKNIRIFDNKYQPCIDETVKILYDPDKGSEAMRNGLRMIQEGKRVAFVMTSCKKARALANQASKLQKPDGSPILTCVYFGQMDGKQRQNDFADINATWSGLDCIIYTSTVEAGISFEIPNHFDAIIAITVKGHREWYKIADCYALDSSPAVETYIEVEYQRRLSVKYFLEILCSLIASTGASLELITIEETSLAKVTRVEVSNTIKKVAKKIEVADAELIANSSDISSDDAEIIKQIPTRSFTDNMILQHHYLWKIYASGDIGDKDDIRNWSMNNDDWIKLCDINFVKKFNSPEPLQHFRRLAYFRRQDSMDPASTDLHKFYSAKQWEAVRDLFQSIGFSGIDDTKILSGDDVAKTFEQSREKIVKIREDALLLFDFKTRAKGLPDLKATVKLINAIVGNWCDYTIKNGETRVGPRTN